MCSIAKLYSASSLEILKLADIYTDAVTLKKVSEDVNRLLARDENLEEEENRELRKRLDRFMEEKYEKLNL